jgi:nitrite reductase (NADH) small subunit
MRKAFVFPLFIAPKIIGYGRQGILFSKIGNMMQEQVMIWFMACRVTDVPANGGVCVKYKEEQIALFHFTRRNEWYATQNLCPHRQQMALSRGMIGTQNGEPKVACPFHKKTFSLATGACLQGDECDIRTYPVKVENDWVYIGVNN